MEYAMEILNDCLKQTLPHFRRLTIPWASRGGDFFGSGGLAELRAEYKTSIEQKWCVNMDAASHVLCRMKYKYNDVSLATRGTNKISTAAILRFHNGTSFPHYVYRVGLFPYVVYLSCSLSAHGTNAAPAGAQLPTHTGRIFSMLFANFSRAHDRNPFIVPS